MRSPVTRAFLLLSLGLSLGALAACDPHPATNDSEGAGADNGAVTAPVADASPLPDATPTTAPSPTPSPSPTASATPRALTPAEDTPGPIPLVYRGVWAIEAKDCTGQPGMTRISISPAAIRYYEGRSEVKRVETIGGNNRITIDVAHHAEGQVEESRQTLVLSGDGQRLTFTRGGMAFAYRRCG